MDYLYEKLSNTAVTEFNVLVYPSVESMEPLPNEIVIFNLNVCRNMSLVSFHFLILTFLQESKLYYKVLTQNDI